MHTSCATHAGRSKNQDESGSSSFRSLRSSHSGSLSTPDVDWAASQRYEAPTPLRKSGKPVAVSDAFARLEREALQQPRNAFARMERDIRRENGSIVEEDLNVLKRSIQQLHLDARTHVLLEVEKENALSDLRTKVAELQQVL